MRFLRLGCVICAVAPLGALRAQRAPPPPAVRVVQRLYADFACEAVVEEPRCDPQHELLDQSQVVLERYFDTNLARLWRADRQCEVRTHEVCRIDFLPIWASQDPSGTFVRILPTPDSTRVNVELRRPFDKEAMVLHYTVVRTTTGWRIHDIAREGEWSLLSLLSKRP